MHDKPFTVGIYLLIGLLIAFAPIMAQLFRSSLTSATVWRRVATPRVLGCFGGLVLGATLPWWLKTGPMWTFHRGVAYAVIVAVCLLAFAVEARATEGRTVPLKARTALLVVAGLLAAVACFSTGLLSLPAVKFTAWHHWGAYIAPAETLLAGGRPFVDFPLQYGFGPTALIAAACGGDCWGHMYYIVGGAGFALALCGLLLAAAVGFRTVTGLAVVLAAVLAAELLWVSYGPALFSPLVTPSVTGLRFLPALGLAVVMWWSERSTGLARRWGLIGFALFAVGALWSPESLFMSTAVWGPYYCLRRLSEAPKEARLKTLVVALVQLALGGVAILGGFLLLYRLTYAVFPKLGAYLIYMLYPPGPLPINWSGPVWFYVVSLGLGVWACWRVHSREGNSGAFRGMLLLTLLCYASGSYALGRSHDNNFLNLLPYCTLILVSVAALRLSRLADGLTAGMLASLLGMLALFGWGGWSNAIGSGALLDFRPQHFLATLSYDNPITQDQFRGNYDPGLVDPVAAARAIAEVRKRSKDPITVLDNSLVNLRDPEVWSSMRGFANYFYVPGPYRAWFVKNGAARLHRSGWLIVHQTLLAPWVDDLKAGYTVTEDLDFGVYRAMHFAPR